MKTGTQIYWSIREIMCSKDSLDKTGFGKFTPRNQSKSALIKALHVYTKGNEKDYKAFDDMPGSVSFLLFVYTKTDGLDVRKEVTVKLDKKTGLISFSDPAFDSKFLLEQYKIGKATLNRDQVSATILNFLESEGGVSMRPSGGIYFIAEHLEHATLPKLHDLFDVLGSGATLFEVTLHNEEGTLAAIEDAVSDKYLGQVDRLVSEINEAYAKGTFTKRQLEGRKTEASKIFAAVKSQSAALRSQAAAIEAKVKSVEKILDIKLKVFEGSIVDDGEFSEMLKLL